MVVNPATATLGAFSTSSEVLHLSWWGW